MKEFYNAKLLEENPSNEKRDDFLHKENKIRAFKMLRNVKEAGS